MSESLFMYVVYDHPKDMPYFYVARRWENGAPTKEVLLATDLEWLRFRLQSRGLVKILRNDTDDPVILETWL